MLEDLTIKDFALIDSDYIEFNRGFTVLSGETGAGKSILIGALSFLLGGKSDVNQIRAGKDEASVSGTFLLPENKASEFESLKTTDEDEQEEPASAWEWLKIHGIEVENNRVLLRRFIRSNGKSGAWVNDTPVTRTDLAQFSSFLVDIHGQHEHQSLMKVPEHRKFLDSRAGLNAEVHSFTELYSQLVAKRKLLSQFSSNESERLRKLDMMSFAVKEIEEAKIKENEDILLEDEQNRLSGFEKIYSETENITQVMTGSEDGIVGALKRLLRSSGVICEMDKSLEKLNNRLESAYYEISDIADEFSNYQSKLVFDPARLSEIEERLSLIYNLKKKYASGLNAPLSEVFKYYEAAKAFIEDNSDSSNKKEQLVEEIRKLQKEILLRAEKISRVRNDCAKTLESEVDNILNNLGMKGTHFGVSIKPKAGNEVEQLCGPYGKDDIEFMISANPGNPLQPLAKIASGGELSRVMLALKTIFAQSQADNVETLIFDEIDTGIGGEVAVEVGNHIKQLSAKKQIFCITHLASIAVYADNQIKIEKSVSGEITSSNVHPIEGEERVREIARMLSGDSQTAQSLEHARSMLNKFSGGF